MRSTCIVWVMVLCLLPAAWTETMDSMVVETLHGGDGGAAKFRSCRSHDECGDREVCMFSYADASRDSQRSGICYVDAVPAAQTGDLDLSLLEVESGAKSKSGAEGSGDTSTLKLMAPKGFASSLVLGTPKYQSYKIGVQSNGKFAIANDANPYLIMDGQTIQMKTRVLASMSMGVAAGSTFMVGTMPQWSLVRCGRLALREPSRTPILAHVRPPRHSATYPD